MSEKKGGKANKKYPSCTPLPPLHIKDTSKVLMTISGQRKRVQLNSQNLSLVEEQNQSALVSIAPNLSFS